MRIFGPSNRLMEEVTWRRASQFIFFT
jgi:hypothetical protein